MKLRTRSRRIYKGSFWVDHENRAWNEIEEAQELRDEIHVREIIKE